MDSHVPSVVANLVMENIEIRALETFLDPPRLWKRYVDRTFVIMKKSKLFKFLTHLNTIESSIQFTTEKKKGCLPFTDLLIKRSPSGHLLSAAYRKPTHSDRYFNFRSEHPTQYKQSVVNALLERAKNFPKHVKRTLLLNGYPPGLWSRKSRHPTPTPGNFDYPTPTPTPNRLRPLAILVT